MKHWLLVWVFILFIKSCPAQVEIFGYFEPQIMAANINDQFYQLASNKLRVDLQLKANDKFSFAANFDYITYHGKTEWEMMDFLSPKIRSEIPNYQLFGYEFDPYRWRFSDRQFLDNAFLKLHFSKFDLTAGKQQISLGSGYVWNPTDVFNRKDIIDPTYEQPGHNALRIDLPLYKSWQFMGIYAPTDNWKNPDLLAKLKTTIGHFDISLLRIQKRWKFSDARIVDIFNQSISQLPVTREIYGFDLAGELLGIGVWAEAAQNKLHINSSDWQHYQNQIDYVRSMGIGTFSPMEIPTSYSEWVAGFDYTFEFQTYIMAEFYQNNFAKDNSTEYNFNDWMQYFLGEIKTIARNQIYGMIQHPITDLLTGSLSGIYCFSDGSYAILPMIVYNIFEDVDLTLIGNFYLGKDGTAYSKLLGNGFLARARAYF